LWEVRDWQWLALTASIWAGSLVFAALGVAIGYLASGDTVRPITMLFYFGLSILGGLWMPTTTFPEWLQEIAKWVPTHAYAALGQAVAALPNSGPVKTLFNTHWHPEQTGSNERLGTAGSWN